MGRKQQTVFWGCNLAYRLPFLEKTTRLVLDTLGYDPVTPDGLTCCPDPVYGKAMDDLECLTLAARNLALCGERADDLLVACNGCYATFAEASSRLRDRGLRERVNRTLQPLGLTYESPPRLLHILPFFDTTVGTETLKKAMRFRLEGLRLGVHYGCHILNTPSSAVDDPAHPAAFERVLSTTGLETVPYDERLLCCGGATYDFDPEGSLGLMRRKFAGARKCGIQALVLCCPLCFVQMDTQAKKLERDEVLPVFFITEMLALGLGIPEEALNLDWHAGDAKGLVTRSLHKTPVGETPEGALDMERLRACCGACTHECTAAGAFPDNDLLRFDPVAVVERVVTGHLEEVLEDPVIWRCLKCRECSGFCPFGDGLAPFFEALQRLAMGSGVSAEPFAHKAGMIRTTGMGMPRNKALRKDFGLPETRPLPGKDLKHIVDSSSEGDMEVHS